MPGRSRDKVLSKGRVVYLSTGRSRGRRGGYARAGGTARKRARSAWNAVALVAFLAIAVVGGREGADLRGLGAWLSGGAVQPLRAAINVSSGRADCRVVEVIDGDTVDLDCPGEGFLRTRLLGFDTPEVSSPGCASELELGNAATYALRRRISGSAEMRVDFRGSDRYGRRLARLSLDGRDVAGPMIAEGLARPYEGGRRRSWCG